MNEEKRKQETTDGSPDQEGRRRLLKGLVATTPVILSVTSRPVLAARTCSESGQLSGNLSDAVTCQSEGCSPGYWKNHTNRWHRNYPTDATFNSVFGVTAFSSSATLDQVIDQQADPTSDAIASFGNCSNAGNLLKQLGFHAVAALQNAATNVKYDLDVLAVRASVQAAIGSGNCAEVESLKNTLDYYNNQSCPLQ